MSNNSQLHGVIAFNPLAGRIAGALDNELAYGEPNGETYLAQLNITDVAVPDQPPSKDTYRQLLAVANDPTRRHESVKVDWNNTVHAINALGRQAVSYENTATSLGGDYMAAVARNKAKQCRHLAHVLFTAGSESTDQPIAV